MKRFNPNTLADINIVIVGDIALDVDVVGTYGLKSRDIFGKPIFTGDFRFSYGRAGNLALNIAALGCKVTLVTYIADDEWGMLLRNIEVPSVELVPVISGRRTKVNIKSYLPEGNFEARIDNRPDEPTLAELEALQDTVARAKPFADAIVVADYTEAGARACGHDAVVKFVTGDIPSFLTSRSPGLLGEVVVDHLVGNIGELVASKPAIECRQTKLITKGGNGAILWQKTTRGDREVWNVMPIPTRPIPAPIDTCGCGDAVMACYVAGITAGYSPRLSAKLGQAAARVVAQQLHGTGNPPRIKDILEAYRVLYNTEPQEEA